MAPWFPPIYRPDVSCINTAPYMGMCPTPDVGGWDWKLKYHIFLSVNNMYDKKGPKNIFFT